MFIGSYMGKQDSDSKGVVCQKCLKTKCICANNKSSEENQDENPEATRNKMFCPKCKVPKVFCICKP